MLFFETSNEASGLLTNNPRSRFVCFCVPPSLNHDKNPMRQAVVREKGRSETRDRNLAEVNAELPGPKVAGATTTGTEMWLEYNARIQQAEKRRRLQLWQCLQSMLVLYMLTQKGDVLKSFTKSQAFSKQNEYLYLIA